MIASRSTRLGSCAVLVGAVLAHAPDAAAAEPTCPALAVEATPAVEDRWDGITDDVRNAFLDRADIDRCAAVSLRTRDATIVAEVVLPDGRSTSRAIARREDVVPALEALLLLPVHDAESAPTGPPSINPPLSAPADSPPKSSANSPSPAASKIEAPLLTTAWASSSRRERDTPSIASGPSLASTNHVRFELSVLTGARVGDGRSAFGLGAQMFLDASGWLVGFGTRIDRYWSFVTAEEDAAALETAVYAGRRTRLTRSIAWDVFLGPAFTFEGTSSYEIHRPDGVESGSSSGILPRFVAGTRLTFGGRSVFRTFVGLDGELGPSHRDDDVPDAPGMPIWTLGLALGATAGTP